MTVAKQECRHKEQPKFWCDIFQFLMQVTNSGVLKTLQGKKESDIEGVFSMVNDEAMK